MGASNEQLYWRGMKYLIKCHWYNWYFIQYHDISLFVFPVRSPCETVQTWSRLVTGIFYYLTLELGVFKFKFCPKISVFQSSCRFSCSCGSFIGVSGSYSLKWPEELEVIGPIFISIDSWGLFTFIFFCGKNLNVGGPWSPKWGRQLFFGALMLF